MFEFAVQGLLVGVIYGLLALPIALLFVATGTIDLAVGAYAALSCALAYLVGGVAGVFVGVLAAVGASALVASIILSLVRKRVDHVSPILASFAAAIFIESAILTKFGKDPFVLSGFDQTISVLTVPLRLQSMINLLVAGGATLSLCLLLYGTHWGRCVRAIAANARGATLAGIAVGRLQFITFLIAGALAGIGGVLVLYSGGADFTTGLHLTLTGLSAAIIFGLSGPVHALLGGAAIGVIEGVSAGYANGGLASAVPLFFLLIALALARGGLAGVRV